MTEIQEGSEVARGESEPPSDEQIVFDALKSIPGSSPHRSPAWYALNRILRDRDGAEDMLGFDYDSVVRKLIADRDNWRASNYAERQMRLAAERGRDWFKDSLKQEHANVERLVKEKNGLLVILADARYEERTENETASLVDPPPHSLLAREGTTDADSTKAELKGLSFTIPLNSEPDVAPTGKEGRRRANVPARDTERLELPMRDKCTCDPKTVCKRCKVDKARNEVVLVARAIAWADSDETHPDLHKALRALDKAQS